MTVDFNPRSRVGSDPRSPDAYPPAGHFNPRSRVGSDLTVGMVLDMLTISIHAPA